MSTPAARSRSQHPIPGQPGQDDVEHDRVEAAGERRAQRGRAVAHRDDVHALGREPARQRGAHPGLVVHHQHPCHQGSTGRHRAQAQNSQHAWATLRGMAGRRKGPHWQRPSGDGGAVGLGLLVITGGADGPTRAAAGRPRTSSAPCSPPPTPGRSPAPSSWTTTSACRRCRSAAGAANGTSTARIWSGGDDKGRVRCRPSPASAPWSPTARPSGRGTPRTARWSADPSTTRRQPPADPDGGGDRAIEQLRATSTVAVDGTAEVAGRDAYELVLTPAPTERTLLREVRWPSTPRSGCRYG